MPVVGGQLIAGFAVLRVHPRHLLTEEEAVLLELFDAFQGGGFGAGPMPFQGGYAEQPAALMAAFREIGMVANALRPRKP